MYPESSQSVPPNQYRRHIVTKKSSPIKGNSKTLLELVDEATVTTMCRYQSKKTRNIKKARKYNTSKEYNNSPATVLNRKEISLNPQKECKI